MLRIISGVRSPLGASTTAGWASSSSSAVSASGSFFTSTIMFSISPVFWSSTWMIAAAGRAKTKEEGERNRLFYCFQSQPACLKQVFGKTIPWQGKVRSTASTATLVGSNSTHLTHPSIKHLFSCPFMKTGSQYNSSSVHFHLKTFFKQWISQNNEWNQTPYQYMGLRQNLNFRGI